MSVSFQSRPYDGQMLAVHVLGTGIPTAKAPNRKGPFDQYTRSGIEACRKLCYGVIGHVGI